VPATTVSPVTVTLALMSTNVLPVLAMPMLLALTLSADTPAAATLATPATVTAALMSMNAPTALTTAELEPPASTMPAVSNVLAVMDSASLVLTASM
jgi:hypothetical protein